MAPVSQSWHFDVHPGRCPAHPLQGLLEKLHKDPPPHIWDGALIEKLSSDFFCHFESFPTEPYSPKIYTPKSPQDSLPKPPEFCLASVIRGTIRLCLTVTSLICAQRTVIMEAVTEKLENRLQQQEGIRVNSPLQGCMCSKNQCGFSYEG